MSFRNQKMGFYVRCWRERSRIMNSVTRIFYERGWRGVNIEPNADEFKKIIQARPRDSNYKRRQSLTLKGRLPFSTRPRVARTPYPRSTKRMRKTLSKNADEPSRKSHTGDELLRRFHSTGSYSAGNLLCVDRCRGFEKAGASRHRISRSFGPPSFASKPLNRPRKYLSYQAWEELLVENNYVFAMLTG